MYCWTIFEIIYLSIIVVTMFGNYIMAKHNYFIAITSPKLDFLEKKWHFDLYLTFNDPLILIVFYHHLPD